MRIAFPAYSPDTPQTTADMSNLAATTTGFRPVKGFSPVTSALPGILGGASFIGSDGTSALLGGTATDLHRYSGGAWVSALGSLSATSWRYDQFGNNVICANGGLLVSYDLVAGTASEIVGSPISSLVATVRDQVFAAGDPSDNNLLSISGFNDSAGWTPGTNQSLAVPFPSGGAIMGVCGGETGLILQQRSIKRATYTGDVTVWQFDEIAKDVGCLAKGSVAQVGNIVFFLSEEGFKACDRNSVVPIGNEQVDATFFASYSRPDIVDKIRAAVDPRALTVTWSMPGTPGRMLTYNYGIKKWYPIDTNVESVFQGFSANISLEALDALYPSGLDSIPISLDSTMFAGGNPLFFVVDNNDVIGTMTGDNLAGYISLDPAELDPGYRVRFRSATLIGDVLDYRVTIDARARAGDPQNLKASGSTKPDGSVALRANGRYNGVRVDIPSGVWTYTQAIDLEFVREGSR